MTARNEAKKAAEAKKVEIRDRFAKKRDYDKSLIKTIRDEAKSVPTKEDIDKALVGMPDNNDFAVLTRALDEADSSMPLEVDGADGKIMLENRRLRLDRLVGGLTPEMAQSLESFMRSDLKNTADGAARVIRANKPDLPENVVKAYAERMVAIRSAILGDAVMVAAIMPGFDAASAASNAQSDRGGKTSTMDKIVSNDVLDISDADVEEVERYKYGVLDEDGNRILTSGSNVSFDNADVSEGSINPNRSIPVNLGRSDADVDNDEEFFAGDSDTLDNFNARKAIKKNIEDLEASIAKDDNEFVELNRRGTAVRARLKGVPRDPEYLAAIRKELGEIGRARRAALDAGDDDRVGMLDEQKTKVARLVQDLDDINDIEAEEVRLADRIAGKKSKLAGARTTYRSLGKSPLEVIAEAKQKQIADIDREEAKIKSSIFGKRSKRKTEKFALKNERIRIIKEKNILRKHYW
jgi:hypothetical protein